MKKSIYAVLCVVLALFGAMWWDSLHRTSRTGSDAAAAKPMEFRFIPAGEFVMGDTLDGEDIAPPHRTNVSTFLIQTTEVTKAQWDEVRDWAIDHGYSDLRWVPMANAHHPVTSVSWYDTLRWCNAKSEKEGLTPCYYTDAAQSHVYRLDRDYWDDRVPGSAGNRSPRPERRQLHVARRQLGKLGG